MKWMGGQRKRNLKSNNYFNKKTTYRRQKAFFKNHTNVKPPHIQRSNNDHHVSAKRLLSKRKDSDTRHIIDLENNDGEIYDINTRPMKLLKSTVQMRSKDLLYLLNDEIINDSTNNNNNYTRNSIDISKSTPNVSSPTMYSIPDKDSHTQRGNGKNLNLLQFSPRKYDVEIDDKIEPTTTTKGGKDIYYNHNDTFHGDNTGIKKTNVNQEVKQEESDDNYAITVQDIVFINDNVVVDVNNVPIQNPRVNLNITTTSSILNDAFDHESNEEFAVENRHHRYTNKEEEDQYDMETNHNGVVLTAELRERLHCVEDIMNFVYFGYSEQSNLDGYKVERTYNDIFSGPNINTFSEMLCRIQSFYEMKYLGPDTIVLIFKYAFNLYIRCHYYSNLSPASPSYIAVDYLDSLLENLCQYIHCIDDPYVLNIVESVTQYFHQTMSESLDDENSTNNDVNINIDMGYYWIRIIEQNLKQQKHAMQIDDGSNIRNVDYSRRHNDDDDYDDEKTSNTILDMSNSAVDDAKAKRNAPGGKGSTTITDVVNLIDDDNDDIHANDKNKSTSNKTTCANDDTHVPKLRSSRNIDFNDAVTKTCKATQTISLDFMKSGKKYMFDKSVGAKMDDKENTRMTVNLKKQLNDVISENQCYKQQVEDTKKQLASNNSDLEWMITIANISRIEQNFLSY